MFSQQVKKDSAYSFNLKQAQDYALQNSPVMKNANIDIESAKKKIWETTAIGLPQINSKLAYTYMINVPDKIQEFSSLSQLGNWMYMADTALKRLSNEYGFGHVGAPDPNQKIVSEKDLKWGLTYDITVSEIIFNGGYIVGLQTAKIFRQLSELSATKSQNDLLEAVTNAYYLVLIAQENKNIVDSTYSNTEKIFNNIKEMYLKGLIEETDVDQMQLTLSTLKNTAEMLTRQIDVVKNLLKFQMGIDLSQNIILTDNLDVLIQGSDLGSLALKEFKVENFADYKLMDVQAKLAGLNFKLQKSSLLPDIAAFYNHQENFNKNSFSFTPPDIIGLNVNIPIFGSGMKLAKISQAKLGLEKAINSKQQVSLGLQTAFAEAKSSYLNALSKFQTNKQNVLLAEKIYKRILIKYNAGIAGSLDLSQAQNQYLQAQSNYYNTIIELTTAKSKLEKMLK
ncbi:MAG: TolC family protein [Bacteroidales bacterium]|nr:TolC family protein [Bacteroidales bacterium]